MDGLFGYGVIYIYIHIVDKCMHSCSFLSVLFLEEVGFVAGYGATSKNLESR